MKGLIFEIHLSCFVIANAGRYLKHSDSRNIHFYLTHQGKCFVDDLILEIKNSIHSKFMQYQCKNTENISWNLTARGKKLSLRNCFDLDLKLNAAFANESKLYLVVRAANVAAMDAQKGAALDAVRVLSFPHDDQVGDALRNMPQFATTLAALSPFRPDEYEALSTVAGSIIGAWLATSRISVDVEQLFKGIRDPILSIDAQRTIDTDLEQHLTATLNLETDTSNGFLCWHHTPTGLSGFIPSPIGSTVFNLYRDAILQRRPTAMEEFMSITQA